MQRLYYSGVEKKNEIVTVVITLFQIITSYLQNKQ